MRCEAVTPGSVAAVLLVVVDVVQKVATEERLKLLKLWGRGPAPPLLALTPPGSGLCAAVVEGVVADEGVVAVSGVGGAGIELPVLLTVPIGPGLEAPPPPAVPPANPPPESPGPTPRDVVGGEGTLTAAPVGVAVDEVIGEAH